MEHETRSILHTSIRTIFSNVQGQEPIIQILKGGVRYFLCVFGAGCLLGPIRLLWLVPRIGTRGAELLEMPIMAVVIFLAASWVCMSLSVPLRLPERLGIGVVALGFLLLAEFTLVLWLQGITIAEYVAGRDPVAGIIYIVMLGVFAVMPLLVVRR